MSYKAISFIVLCLLFSLTSSLNIQRDLNNPLLINPPWNAQTGSKILIRFSFPAATPNAVGPSQYGSYGLNFKQFIGVVFPSSIGTELGFDQTIKWGCALEDGTNTYTMNPVLSEASLITSSSTKESNIAYCRLDDATANVPLKTGPSIVYKFTLTLNFKFSSSYLHNLALFTSTTNNPDKMIIDSLPVLGSLALYGDYTATKALELTPGEVNVLPTASSTSTSIIYPYSQFDTPFTLKSNTFITAEDHIIVFRFPTDTVTGPTTVTTEDAATNDKLAVALKGNIALKPFGADAVYLDGITEDLVPGRQFKISLKGWKARDTNIATPKPLEVIVYYRNTYSILSYAKYDYFSITRAQITLSANHPEFWDIYQGGAWPITFKFKTNTDLVNGGWVVIQHSNPVTITKDKGNVLTFVTSTCDFSEDTSGAFDQSFGKRNNCFPLRTLPVTTSTNAFGSGFFFYMKPTISQDKTYIITIWAFFDSCGGTGEWTTPDLSAFNVLSGTKDASYTNPEFSINIYKNIFASQLNENRFTSSTGDTQNSIATTSTSNEFAIKCWNNIMFAKAAVLNTDWTAAVVDKVYTGATNKSLFLHYKEVFDWYAYSVTTDTYASTLTPYFINNPYKADFLTSKDDGKFIYTSGNSSTSSISSSYFAVGYNNPGVAASNIWLLTPVPFGQDVAATINHPKGKWWWQFPSKWFDQGQTYKNDSSATNGCYASWNFSGYKSSDAANSQKFTDPNLLTTFNANRVIYNYPTDSTTPSKNSFIGAKVYHTLNNVAGTLNIPTIDSAASLLPPDQSTKTKADAILRIVSDYHDGTAASRWNVLKDYTAASVTSALFSLQVAYYTSCVKWRSSFPIITSLYTYIDVQIKWNYQDSSNGAAYPIANTRFIKLFPETGVFNEFTKNPTNTNVSPYTTTPLLNHVIYTDSTNESICLIELSAEAIRAQKSTSSTLVIWMFFGTLLETDYYDVGATYPVAPLLSGNVWGLQAGQPMEYTNPWMTPLTNFTPILAQLNKNNTTSGAIAISNSSSYLWFMGSVLIFENVTSTNLTATTETSFLIPYYCPRYNSNFLLTSGEVTTLTAATTGKEDLKAAADAAKVAADNLCLVTGTLCLAKANAVSDKATADAAKVAADNACSADPICAAGTACALKTTADAAATAATNALNAFNTATTNIEAAGAPAVAQKALYDDKVTKDGNVVTAATAVTTAKDFVRRAHAFPLLMAAWMTASQYNSITSLNKWVSYNNQVKLFGSLAGTNRDITKILTSSIAPAIVSKATLQFSPYFTTNTNNNLYVFNGTIGSANPADIFCTGHSLFLNSSISFETTPTPTLNDSGITGTIGYTPTAQKTFYAFGKTFNKAVFYGIGFTNSLPTVGNVKLKAADGSTASFITLYYSGIKRPTISTFLDNTNKFILSDRVAYACVPNNRDQNKGLSNYLVDGTTRKFLLDIAKKVDGLGWTNITMTADKKENIKSDTAGNFRLVLSPPNTIPIGVTIKITGKGSLINTNSLCGLYTSNDSIVTPCSMSSTSASCIVPTTGSSFTICCYNIVISEPIALQGVQASFPQEQGLESYLTKDIYSAEAQITDSSNPFLWATGNDGFSEITNSTTGKSAKITNVAYSQVTQETGIGKVTFTVNLPREPIRDMRLTIKGDMSGMLVNGNIPRCVASFGKDNYGSSWNVGDALIDSCSVSNISGTSPIIITTKRMLYKCGGTLSTLLYVSLWPVLIVNWTTASSKSFKIDMNINSADFVAASQSFDLTLPSQLSAKPNFTGQWDTLCPVSSITPKIPGELADYQFDIDLDTNKVTLANTNPNEVTIFWPYQYFGSFIPNVMCFYNGMLNCSFTDEGILNIRFPTNLTVGSGKKISITIVGVPNPITEDNFSFPCTVNNTNFSTGARVNLITGSGKLTGGINTNSILSTSIGALRFLKVSTPVTDKNPRNTSVHKFRIAFDNAVSLTTLPVTVANTPVIHIYFPSEYKLGWYTNKASASIDEYTSDNTNLITKTSTIAPASIVQSGNRITLTLTQASYTFLTNWRYWDITITNIINPIDSTIQTGPPATQTTRPFQITLTNSNLTCLYRTYTNGNTYVSDALTAPVDNNLGWNRGNSFSFDNSKWVIDIYSVANQLNILTVKAGRYVSAYFEVKANSSNVLTPAITSLSLTDATFKTSVAAYSLNTSYKQPLQFYIGCTCGTAPGYYLVNFTSSDTTVFAALSPIAITVDTSSRGIISSQTPPTIPAGGSVMIGLILSDSNFDQLNVNWTAGDNAKNDDSAKITNVVIPVGTITPISASSGQTSPLYSMFSITSSSTTLPPQSFKTVDPNACYTWNGLNTITFNIAGQTAIIPSSLDLTTYFKYYNADTDSTITVKNAIKFNFTPPAAPIYIYCALACINMAYPADSDILVPKVTNTNYLQFYSSFISNTTPVDIVFSNLVRGMQYHMRCILQSTQGDVTLRTSSSANIENYKIIGTTNTTTVNIQPSNPQATQCVQWQFLSEPGQQTRLAVVNYCQKLFSTNGWANNGCVICTFSDMSYVPAGLSLPTNITCPTTTVVKRLRFLQATTVNPPNVTADVATTLTVCPIAHPVCASDVSGNKVYADLFNQLITDLKTPALFKSTLNFDNVRLNTTVPTVTVTDSIVPDITKLIVSVTNSAANGAFTAATQFISPVVCYWQISDSATAPTFNALQGCTDSSWCGKAKVGVTASTISTTNLKAFTAGSTYNLYVGCTNDIPMAQKQSAVKSMGSFTIPTATNPTTTDNTTSTVTPTTTSSSFSSFSSFMILMLLALLFI